MKKIKRRNLLVLEKAKTYMVMPHKKKEIQRILINRNILEDHWLCNLALGFSIHEKEFMATIQIYVA